MQHIPYITGNDGSDIDINDDDPEGYFTIYALEVRCARFVECAAFIQRIYESGYPTITEDYYHELRVLHRIFLFQEWDKAVLGEHFTTACEYALMQHMYAHGCTDEEYDAVSLQLETILNVSTDGETLYETIVMRSKCIDFATMVFRVMHELITIVNTNIMPALKREV